MEGLYRKYIGLMEKKMETTIVYWGYMSLYSKFLVSPVIMKNQMEKNMENEMGTGII